jgi:hypothetical protein
MTNLTLNAGEIILIHSKPHWVQLAKPAMFLLLGLSCSCCTGLVALAEPPPGQEPLPREMIGGMVTCSGLVLALALLGTIIVTLRYINSDFYLTNQRVILVRGGGRRRSLDIPMRHIDSVSVETSSLGRLLGYGQVWIMSNASRQPLFKFANPEAIRSRLHRQLASMK